MGFELLILGSSSATPMFGRNPTAQLLRIKEQLILIDCGEGTQIRLSKNGIKINKIDHVFISHLHGDHYLGLVGLISSMHLMGRKRKLVVYGPKGLDEILNIQFKYSETILAFQLEFFEIDPSSSQVILENNLFEVRSIPLDHRISCTGFLFSEKPERPKLNLEKVEALGIPLNYYRLIKSKQDYTSSDGTLYPWQDLTLPPRPILKYAYCSDTVDSGTYHSWIEGVDLLYHEATFMDDLRDRAVQTFHTTALQAGEIASKVAAKALLIGHFSARYRELEPLLLEAKSKFENTKLAIEGRWFQINEDKL